MRPVRPSTERNEAMSDLTRLYAEAREGGLCHGDAVAELARRLGVDRQTIRRGLARAEREANRPPKRSRPSKEEK
jgi:transposase-like protein